METKRNILLTGVGAPGVQGTIYALRQLQMHIVGTDVNAEAVGKYLCDDFCTIPPARNAESYLSAMLAICAEKKIDVVVPQNTAELVLLATHKAKFEEQGTRVLVSNQQAIENANNKYYLLKVAKELGVATCDFSICSDFDTLASEVQKRRKQGELTVVKPPCGNGSRGVRIIIDANDRDRKSDFFDQKPSALYCTLDELHDVLGDEFPELLVMDYLEGDEYTVDVMRTDKNFIAIPRKREAMRSGITFRASLENNPQIIEACRLLADNLDLNYCFGFQFKNNKQNVPILLECNPRVQGTMVMSVMAGANIIAESVRCLLGDEPNPMKIDWTTRLIRYWGAIGVNESGLVKI